MAATLLTSSSSSSSQQTQSTQSNLKSKVPSIKAVAEGSQPVASRATGGTISQSEAQKSTPIATSTSGKTITQSQLEQSNIRRTLTGNKTPVVQQPDRSVSQETTQQQSQLPSIGGESSAVKPIGDLPPPTPPKLFQRYTENKPVASANDGTVITQKMAEELQSYRNQPEQPRTILGTLTAGVGDSLFSNLSQRRYRPPKQVATVSYPQRTTNVLEPQTLVQYGPWWSINPVNARLQSSNVLQATNANFFNVDRLIDRAETSYARTGDALPIVTGLSLGVAKVGIETFQFGKQALSQNPLTTAGDVLTGLTQTPKAVLQGVKELPTDSPVRVAEKIGYTAGQIALGEATSFAGAGALEISGITAFKPKVTLTETKSILFPNEQGGVKVTTSTIKYGKEELTAKTTIRLNPDYDQSFLVNQYTELQTKDGKVVGLSKGYGRIIENEKGAVVTGDSIIRVNKQTSLFGDTNRAIETQGKSLTAVQRLTEDTNIFSGIGGSKLINKNADKILTASDISKLQFESKIIKVTERVSPTEYAKILSNEGKLIYKETTSFLDKDIQKKANDLKQVSDDAYRDLVRKTKNPLSDQFLFDSDSTMGVQFKPKYLQFWAKMKGYEKAVIPEKGAIYIKKSLSQTEKEVTTAHELIHMKTPKFVYNLNDIYLNLAPERLTNSYLGYRLLPSEVIAFGGEKIAAKVGFKVVREVDSMNYGFKTDTAFKGFETVKVERPIEVGVNIDGVSVSVERPAVFSVGGVKSVKGSAVADYIKSTGLDFGSVKVGKDIIRSGENINVGGGSTKVSASKLKLGSVAETAEQLRLAQQFVNVQGGSLRNIKPVPMTFVSTLPPQFRTQSQTNQYPIILNPQPTYTNKLPTITLAPSIGAINAPSLPKYLTDSLVRVQTKQNVKVEEQFNIDIKQREADLLKLIDQQPIIDKVDPRVEIQRFIIPDTQTRRLTDTVGDYVPPPLPPPSSPVVFPPLPIIGGGSGFSFDLPTGSPQQRRTAKGKKSKRKYKYTPDITTRLYGNFLNMKLPKGFKKSTFAKSGIGLRF